MKKRAPDFKFVFANALGMAISDNDIKIVFGIEEGDGPENMLEQIGVVMTHKTAKLLGNHILTMVQHFEKVTGVEVPFDEDKRQKLIEVLNAANGLSNDSEPPSGQSQPAAPDS